MTLGAGTITFASCVQVSHGIRKYGYSIVVRPRVEIGSHAVLCDIDVRAS